MSAVTAVEQVIGESAAPLRVPGISVVVTERIEEVEAAWRQLEALGIDCPGQGLDFVRTWLDTFAVRKEDRVFVLAALNDRPVVLLPLYRKRWMGLSVATWLTGDHLGQQAPLVDKGAFAAMSDFDRHQVWNRLARVVLDTDLISLPNVPTDIARPTGLADLFHSMKGADRGYRARFESWEECDGAQRNKHRRKVDRQQAAKLAALGVPHFEVLKPGDPVDDVIETMFAQKAVRFGEMGIADPFAPPHVRAFYRDVFDRAGGVLHVLRLDGEVIAVRYNLTAGGGLYCLISSMTTCAATQSGSPGKQCLLGVMQSAFDEGYAFVDLGRGENDEKRQWCNERVELGHYCHVLTPLGHIAWIVQRLGEHVRASVKGNRNWFALAKRLRRGVAGGKS
ncbi:GNAT family N-acetyltransferase [Pelagibacterium limicola]|uniref:GNAT family N-acetyltransferase n=1 Tax=Pelagibacterium limicola TaxID=2791022 RepID=UPI0018AF54E2|nr:GNAT family N-acetyltransferase [Pelagibacterium limicola]